MPEREEKIEKDNFSSYSTAFYRFGVWADRT